MAGCQHGRICVIVTRFGLLPVLAALGAAHFGSSMLSFIVRRLWQMLPTMLGVVVLVFVLFNWVGGDPAYLLAGKMADTADIENIRRQLGTDQPYPVQLWIFIQQILSFDFGNAWSTGN